MTGTLPTAKKLSAETGAIVENHNYDRGYWARVAGYDKPYDGEARVGWDTADKELRNEAKTQP